MISADLRRRGQERRWRSFCLSSRSSSLQERFFVLSFLGLELKYVWAISLQQVGPHRTEDSSSDLFARHLLASVLFLTTLSSSLSLFVSRVCLSACIVSVFSYVQTLELRGAGRRRQRTPESSASLQTVLEDRPLCLSLSVYTRRRCMSTGVAGVDCAAVERRFRWYFSFL